MDSGGVFSRGESRHPEWDLMYRRGLTVKRIAELCDAVPQTVSRHIRVQRVTHPDMAAEHVANRPADKPPPPGAEWQAKVADLAWRVKRYATLASGSDVNDLRRKA